MDRARRLLILAMPCALLCEAQTTLVLQPDAAEGKDATLHGLSSEVNNNWGSIDQWCASAWTFNGVPGTVRSVIGFDLSSIPAGANVLSAGLSLYAWDQTGGFGQHSELSGPNDAWLQRVITPWNEGTVTWNSAPSTTTLNQVALPGTSNPLQDYLDIDVAAMVQDMVDDPASSHGFLLRLQTETYYRRLNFCTSDHADNDRHPRLVVTYTVPVEADTCIVISSGPFKDGKDAALHGLVSESDVNWGAVNQFPANAWTFLGTPGVLRSVVEFDLGQVPPNAIVASAGLSLFAYGVNDGWGTHSNLSGSNAGFVQRVTTPWEEDEVTWNTQPATTTLHQVELAESTSPTQDYENIDVTLMVQDMIDDPDNSHGFMIRLQNENYYRCLNFCSSDHVNETRHPRLEVCYVSTIGMEDDAAPSSSLRAFPNPAQDALTVEFDDRTRGPSLLRIVDLDGRTIRRERLAGRRSRIDVHELPAGVYQLIVEGARRWTERVVIVR